MEFLQLNLWAIVVCIILNMVLGALWYSPILFGNIWLKLVDKRSEDISKEDGYKSMGFAILPAIISVLTLVIILYIADVQTIPKSIFVTSLVTLGFSGTSAFNLVLFEDRSIKLTLLNVGYTFTALNIAGIILTLWK